LNYAISREVIIVPFRIENLEPSDAMMLHLSSRHWLDAYDPSWEKYLTKLSETIAANLGVAGEKEDIEAEDKTKSLVIVRRRNFLWPVIGSVATLLLGWGIFKLTGGELWSNQIKPTSTNPTMTFTIDFATPTNEMPMSTSSVDGILDISLNNANLDLDPLIWIDNSSTILSDNLFLTLTAIDALEGKIIPEAAESWSVSADGRIYTFKIQEDIPWVKHPLGGNTELVTNENDEIRYLNAMDFVKTIQRICTLGADSGFLAGEFVPIIKGCQAVSEYPDLENLPAEYLENVGARAISDFELLIELENPAAYFLSMTSMYILSAVPHWDMDKYGEAWKNPGIITTNGYYVISDFKIGEKLELRYNEFLPNDLFGSGNIGTVNLLLGKDDDEGYELWLGDQIDLARIPVNDFSDHSASFPEETMKFTGQGVFFIEFNLHEPPFADVHIRRAFSASLDKVAYTQANGSGLLEPTNQFGVPGLVGAPTTDNVGMQYDPGYARGELAAAGYPNCEGFPQVKIRGSPPLAMSEESIHSWEEALGCPENTITFDFSEYDREGADMFVMGFGLDYPDENNLVGDLLSCQAMPSNALFSLRDCSDVDTMILDAQREINPERRAVMYEDIEEAFFGRDGIFPVMPFYQRSSPYAVKSGLQPGAFLAYWFESFNKWSINGE
jgi:oligopeptide transport system substrate-binding protein